MLAHSPRIVTDGMVLCLDAANPKNYNLTEVEVLVVAGGGGGAADVGGAGGAGGLVYNRNFAVTPGTQLTATVGDGGAGRAPFDGSSGGSGGSSVFGSITATGGGGGGNYPSGSGTTGGSGGGGSNSGSGGAGTSGQGFAGGSGNGQSYQSGGGGGAGEAGKTGSGIVGGNGGNGLEFPQFASVGGFPSGWFAGGGGGGGGNDGGSDGRGFGGLGGGGTGASRSGTYATNSSFRDAVANTGGGGGGTGGWNTAGNGGSGIIIVRYPGPQKAIGGTVTSVGGDTIHTFTTSGNFTPLVNTNASAVLGLSDLSGNRNFGTTANSPTYSSSNGGSLVFDGSNDIITITSTGIVTNNISVDIWFNVNSAKTYTALLGSNATEKYEMLIKSASNLEISLAPGNYIQHNNILSINTWTNIVVSASNGVAWKVYKNGVDLGTPPVIAGTYQISGTGVSNIDQGRIRNDVGSFAFSGNIASTKIYNRALTAAEISQNFNALRGRYGL